MKNRVIPDSAIEVSSSYNQDSGSDKARLEMTWNGGYNAGWKAATSDLHQWLQINLANVTNITKIATQGGQTKIIDTSNGYYISKEWVNSFSLSYKLDDKGQFLPYQNNKVRARVAIV